VGEHYLDTTPPRLLHSLLSTFPDPQMNSKIFFVISGIVLCSVVAHVLSLYIEWCPALDLPFFIIIVFLNCSQLAV
jgi:hypothetical protein